jgi:hypothetical protein
MSPFAAAAWQAMMTSQVGEREMTHGT